MVLLLLVPLRAVAEEPLYKDFQELQLRLEEAHSRMVLIRVIFIAALIIIIVVFQYLRLRDRRKREAEREENERIMAIAEDLRARLADAESAASAASAQKTSMLEKMVSACWKGFVSSITSTRARTTCSPNCLKKPRL